MATDTDGGRATNEDKIVFPPAHSATRQFDQEFFAHA
jgi:hypothetical protein